MWNSLTRRFCISEATKAVFSSSFVPWAQQNQERRKGARLSFQLFAYFSFDQKLIISFSSLSPAAFFFLLQLERREGHANRRVNRPSASTRQPHGISPSTFQTPSACGLFPPRISILDTWDKSRGLRGGSGRRWVSKWGSVIRRRCPEESPEASRCHVPLD